MEIRERERESGRYDAHDILRIAAATLCMWNG
jgi:hypothetical protein